MIHDKKAKKTNRQLIEHLTGNVSDSKSEIDRLQSAIEIHSKAIENYNKLFDAPFASAIFTHVSPFGYSVITSDSLISISLDNYMGSDYKGYEDVFYNYQLPKKVIGTNTMDCMNSGIVNGFASLVDGMITRFEKEMGQKCARIITGGFATTISPACNEEVILDRDVLLYGLNEIYKKNLKG